MGEHDGQGCENTNAELASLNPVSPAKKQWTFDAKTEDYVVMCPTCGQPHVIPKSQLYCCQFACGADARTGAPLRAHIGLREVELLRAQGRLVAGCGNRFRFNPRKGELANL